VKIALDATYAADPTPTGTGIYSQRLIQALAATRLDAANSRTELLLCFRFGPYLRWARKQPWPEGCALSPLLEHWPPAGRVRLFHGLNQRLTKTAYPLRVITVHDLFPMTSADYSTPEFQRHFTEILRSAIERADHIISVSEATRQQLLRHTGARPDRIHVIHHGVDLAVVPSHAEREHFRERILGLNKDEKFFLHVGSLQVRKNVANIVLALQRVPKFRLVLAGGAGFGAEQIDSLIEKEGLTGRVIRLGHASADRLSLLYSSATALVFPSLEEGFGIPLLEAMSYGLPVITSNCSSMPEVGGDAALYVDPLDSLQIGEAMRRVAEDEMLAADLGRRGKERAGLFSWEKCARATWEVYREALNEK